VAPRPGYMRAAVLLHSHLKECETCLTYGRATPCLEGQRALERAQELCGEPAPVEAA